MRAPTRRASDPGLALAAFHEARLSATIPPSGSGDSLPSAPASKSRDRILRFATPNERPPPGSSASTPAVDTRERTLSGHRNITAFQSAALGPKKEKLKTRLKSLPALTMCHNWEVEERIAQRKLFNGRLSPREALFHFLASPASSSAAAAFAGAILGLNLVALVITALENVYDVQRAAAGDGRDASWEWWANMLFSAVFSAELVLRLAVYHRPWRFWMLYVDAVCLAPFVSRLALWPASAVELAEPGRTLLLLLTALLPLRLLKLTRWFTGTMLLARAIKRSATALLIPFFLLSMTFTLLGGILYAVESVDAPPGTAEGTGRVTNVLEGWWMLAVTLTTVGYGDFSPQSAAGRCIAVLAMFIGLIVVAMPLTIVGDRFTQEWESRTMAIITEKFRVWLLHDTTWMEGHGGDLHGDIGKMALTVFDLTGDSYITYTEFEVAVVKRLGVNISPSSLRKLWRSVLDPEGRGSVHYTTLANALLPHLEFFHHDHADLAEAEAAEGMDPSSSDLPPHLPDGSMAPALSGLLGARSFTRPRAAAAD